VFLINGRQLNHYREAVGQRAKTDPDDARLLLRYLTHEHPELRPAPVLDSKAKCLWSLLQRRATLVRARSQLKLSLRGDPETEAIGQDLAEHLTQAITRIERRMTSLAKELGWQASIGLCQTIPGVGSLSALALTACFHRGEFKRADQWVAYMGLDVRVRDSGTCRGRRKLSKRGNPELRRLLFNGAMSAAKMPSIRPRYEQYRARGMSSTEALVAMSRKLARIAFAVLSKGEAYDEKMPGWACACP
jgi:transposase